MKAKLIASCLAGVSLLALSGYANAALKIVNSSKDDLSFSIGKICSSEFGTIKSFTTKLISEDKFFTACEKNPHSCAASVYAGENCSGKNTAKLTFDVDVGLKDVLDSGPYAFTTRPYNILITDAEAGLEYSKNNSEPAPMYQVPFYNADIQGGKKIQVDYNILDPNTQKLVCKYTQHEGIGSLSWGYKGVWFKAPLPVTLASNGYPSDSNGKLTIANHTKDTKNTVTCVYENVA